MRTLQLVNHLDDTQLKEKLSATSGKAEFSRWQILYLIQVGKIHSAAVISPLVNLSRPSIYKIVEQYNKEGVQGVKYTSRGGRRRALLTVAQEEEVLSSIEQKAAKGLVKTANDIRDIVEAKTGKPVSDDYLWDMLNRNSWKKKMPRPHHPKRNIAEQQEFKKKLPDRVAAIQWQLDQPNDSRPVVVFFEDEGRFGRISREMYCWVKKDVIPSVARQMIREYIYAYSAIAPATGDCFSMIAPYCNTESMNLFLKLLAKHYNDYRIVLILDKAGWHISQGLELPANLTLLHLPPYSPELNPVELLWREIRRKYFHNKIFNSLDDVEETLNSALAKYHRNTDDTKQLSNGYAF